MVQHPFVCLCTYTQVRASHMQKKERIKKDAAEAHRRSLVAYTQMHDLPACDRCLMSENPLKWKVRIQITPKSKKLASVQGSS